MNSIQVEWMRGVLCAVAFVCQVDPADLIAVAILRFGRWNRCGGFFYSFLLLSFLFFSLLFLLKWEIKDFVTQLSFELVGILFLFPMFWLHFNLVRCLLDSNLLSVLNRRTCWLLLRLIVTNKRRGALNYSKLKLILHFGYSCILFRFKSNNLPCQIHWFDIAIWHLAVCKYLNALFDCKCWLTWDQCQNGVHEYCMALGRDWLLINVFRLSL